MPWPQSSSIIASAMSIPAVMPADVQTPESDTKMESRSTRTAGNADSSVSHSVQWVVAARPSSRPARARKDAPAQTEARRRILPRLRLSQATTRGSPSDHRKSPPTTMIVSYSPDSRSRSFRVSTARDSSVATAPPSGEK
jgi:hypothetical protein